MNLNEYQDKSYKAIQPHGTVGEEVVHWTLGLTEEAGEVANAVKHKHYCGECIGVAKIAEELGDVLWYVSALCTAYGISLDDVAKLNVAKLEYRYDGANEFDEEKSANRHKKMEEFSHTELYKEIVKRMEV